MKELRKQLVAEGGLRASWLLMPVKGDRVYYVQQEGTTTPKQREAVKEIIAVAEG